MVNSYEQTHWVCYDCGHCHDTRMEADLCCIPKPNEDKLFAILGENDG